MLPIIERSLVASGAARDWFNTLEPDALIRDEAADTTWRVPMYWAGGSEFRFRFAPPSPGRYSWTVRVGAAGAAHGGLEGQSGVIDVADAAASCELLRRGRLSVADDRRTLRHADGSPFLWLGDTWWMAFTRRLRWPDEFTRLADDRQRKGFNVIQVVLGPLPDYDAPDQAFDPAQADSTGWPWEPGWARVNTAYFDRVDAGLSLLIERGMAPCIVGLWGYWGLTMGEARVRQHWRYLVARYAAWPVVWCLAGEAMMATYHTIFSGDAQAIEREAEQQRALWSRLAGYVRQIDPYHNPITLHPRAPGGSRRDLTPDAAIDLEMVQTTHMGFLGLHGHLETLSQSLGGSAPDASASPAAAPPHAAPLPVFSAEANYEGIMGSSWADVQRFMFWTAMTLGCCGHTYGAQGLWGFHSRDNPHRGFTGSWGRGFWEDAMHYSGAAQVGVGAAILRRFPWQRCRPFDEPAAVALGRRWSFATGIPGELSIYYLPASTHDPRHLGIIAPGWMGHCLPIRLSPGASMRASFIDPITGDTRAIGVATPDATGQWTPPRKPSSEDWVLVLEAQ